MEPMGLVFGQELEEPEKRKGKHHVFAGKEPVRPSLSIRRIGDYDLVRTLGSGSTGKVYLAIHRQTHEKLAVKVVPRNNLDPSKKNSKETRQSREKRIFREAAMLNLIEHQHIVNLRDFLITTDYFCLFFEFVEGVQLLDYIIMHGKLKETRARAFFRQILSAVDYCHRNSIVHRDLKIENIMVDEKNGRCKLLDFGLSNFYNPDECLKTFCGSVYFAAPELLCGRLYTGPEVDVWSLGVILFTLVTGRVPFEDKNIAALHEKIKSCRYNIPDHLSPGCKELLSKMICRDPGQRATMDDVIFHSWVNEAYGEVPAYLSPERFPIDNVDDRIVRFLEKEFDIQYSSEEIRAVLEHASEDWAAAFNHPVVSLYFLARDKLLKDGDGLKLAPIQLDSKERSRSLSYIPDMAGCSSPLEAPSEAYIRGKSRARKSSAPESSTAQDIPIIKEDNIECASKSGSFLSRRFSLLSTGRRSKEKIAPRRSLSLSEPNSYRPSTDFLGIKTVYLKGFFSINTTSSRPPMAIRNEIQQYLMLHNIRYEDRRSYFICEHRPSVIKMEAQLNSTEQIHLGRVIFEIHIVKLAFIGLHGIQLKRIQGDLSHYKNLCSQMMSSLKL
jgi:serine/threonine protein kinase